ncbi:MAG: hypothetical protein L6R42_001216 [Xanthoria sp. 1 TBL-2021]|nr:MAG: hypothetical protein L6R42_001216 [Xanthoria sp. 1 TBL-2021]
MQAWTPASATFDAPENQRYTLRQAQVNDNAMNAHRWTFRDKTRWVCRDSGKALQLLGDLQNHNQSLWTTLSPHHNLMLERGVPSLMLPGISDLATLAAIVSRYSHEAGSTGVLASCADLRARVLSSGAERSDSEMIECLKLDYQKDILSRKSIGVDHGPQRDTAELRRVKGSHVNVIIEHQNLNPNMNTAKRLLAIGRLKTLVELLSHERYQDFGLLQAVGFFWEAATPLRFEIASKHPVIASGASMGACSLQSLLLSSGSAFKNGLEDRCVLALALATALLQLHASGWLHKGLRPQNIVFGHIEAQLPDISTPKLLGFSVSRPDHPEEVSLSESGSEKMDMYRHPDCQGQSSGKFRKRHDYFAIGVILLAIGVWEPIEDILKRFKKKYPHRDNPTDRAADLTTYAKGRLWSRCGKIYRDATVRCLTGDFGIPNQYTQNEALESRSIRRAFLLSVVDELVKCKV